MLRTSLARSTLRRSCLVAQQQQPCMMTCRRLASTMPSLPGHVSDPTQNIGDYPTDIPKVNRQLRNPYRSYDNQQERRNFGETLQEEDEVLAVFTPDVHTHVTPGKAALHLLFAGLALYAVALIGYFTFEPLQAVRRTYPNGLEEELGGVNKARSD